MQNNIIMASLESNNREEEDYSQISRETGTFKPILYNLDASYHQYPSIKWNVLPPQEVSLRTELVGGLAHEQSIWRIYLQESVSHYELIKIYKMVETSFEWLSKKDLMNEKGKAFLNISNVLIERMQLYDCGYQISMLDYNCLIVICLPSFTNDYSRPEEYALKCFYVSQPEFEMQHFRDIQCLIKQVQNYKNIFLMLEEDRVLLKVQKSNREENICEVTRAQIQNTTVNLSKKSIIFKSISTQSIQFNIFEEAVFDPLEAVIKEENVFQQMLRRINREHYQAEKISLKIKDWLSFDYKILTQNSKQSKTTPEKLKNINKKHQLAPRLSNNSTNIFNQSEISTKNNKIAMFAQPNKLKISQRVVTGPKQSNLTPSEMDYAVSVKDDKQKQVIYFDQFQNILYDEQMISEQNQLALNNSFEQFERKEECPKDKQILKELNRRRQKQEQEKKLLDEMKNKLKELMNEQKQWICKNFKLKIQIKKFKNSESIQVDHKEIDEIKTKIGQLMSCEEKLMLELNAIKKTDSTKPSAPQERQQKDKLKNRDKIFCSLSNANVDLVKSINFNFTLNKRQQQELQPMLKANNIQATKARKMMPKPIDMAQIKQQNKIIINEHGQEDSAKANINKLNNHQLFSSIPISQNHMRYKPATYLNQDIHFKEKHSFLNRNDLSPRFNPNLHREGNIQLDHSPRVITKHRLTNNIYSNNPDNIYSNNPDNIKNSNNSNHPNNNYQYHHENKNNLHASTPNHLKPNHSPTTPQNNNQTPNFNNFTYQNSYAPNDTNPQNQYSNSTNTNNVSNKGQNVVQNDLIIPNIVFSPSVHSSNYQQFLNFKPAIFNSKI